jgi:hypothetical protein
VSRERQPQSRFSQEDVVAITSVLDLGEEAFIVGGQALNLWAERYSDRAPELRDFAPFTSKDLDYFGLRQAAEKLARALNGRVSYPTADDHGTASTALVVATINGKRITIDFLSNVLGVRPRDLRAVELLIPVRLPEGETRLIVPVMHPVPCLQSRIANVLHPATQRRDDAAMRQLRAALIVVREYIREVLESGDVREAQQWVRDLYRYLRSNELGRIVDHELGIDPLEIVRSVANHSGFDDRFRHHNINTMITAIERRRAARDRGLPLRINSPDQMM